MTGSGSLLLFLLALVAAFFALEGASTLWRAVGARRRQRARLRVYAPLPPEASEIDGAGSLLRGRGASGAFERLALHGALALELRRAALPTTPLRFAALSLALAALGFQALLWWAPGIASAAPGLALGLLPYAWLRRRSAARTRRFEAQFPEALDLMIRALRAGHSLSAGIQLVSEELPDPIGGEFAQVSHEIRLGQPLKTALEHLVLRVGNPDVAFFATAVAVQQETGSNLVEVLRNLSDVIRDRFQLHGKVRALTALGRASANLLAVWPLVMVGVLWLVNADYVAPLWETREGRSMAVFSALMVCAGYALCRRFATIRV